MISIFIKALLDAYYAPADVGWDIMMCNGGRCLSVRLYVCPVPDPKSRTEGHCKLKIGRREVTGGKGAKLSTLIINESGQIVKSEQGERFPLPCPFPFPPLFFFLTPSFLSFFPSPPSP